MGVRKAMGKVEVATTELVWPGKYNADGTRKEIPRVYLPLHIRERLCVRKTDEADKSVWRNKLIWGDNLLVMNSLVEQFAGAIDLIYIDPPFATGADFVFAIPIGENNPEGRAQEQSIIEKKAYRDTWGRDL